MNEVDSKGQPIVAIVRVLEYRGPVEWVTKVMQASRVPMQGEFKGMDGKGLPEGCSLHSGLVVWQIEPVEQEPARQVIPLPPGSTSIQ